MQALLFLIFASSAFPWWRAWLANRSTALASAVVWAILAWAAWAGVGLVATGDTPVQSDSWLRYLALCLTCCAGVAVLGARRPGAAAWNFVVLGLLAVLLLPLVEELMVGGPSHTWVRLIFLLATLLFLFLNYLPTCFAPAAFVLGLATLAELALVSGPQLPEAELISESAVLSALALVPWLAYLCWRSTPVPPSQFDRHWRDFRNRYGLVWAARVRDQFHRAAAHAHWPVQLYWRGLHVARGNAALSPAAEEEILQTLRALLKRF